MTRLDPQSFPLGHSLPAKDEHAVSVSLPTWNNVVQYMKGDRYVHDKLQCDYPRFYQHASVQKLSQAVLNRITASNSVQCAIFPSEAGMRRCIAHLRKVTDATCQTQQMSFNLELAHQESVEEAVWASFSALLYPVQFAQHIQDIWAFMGDGISSRHAEFCLERFEFMASMSSDLSLQTPATSTNLGLMPPNPWRQSDRATKDSIKAEIAKHVTSQKPNQEAVKIQDIFLYPKGMCAIGAVARALVPTSTQSSEAIIFGWPYGSTPKAVRESGYARFTFYSQGTSEELDQLEASLSLGNQISSLFCEIPSNPLCATPQLSRIRSLANKFKFAVVCDDTIGTFINVDVLPFADVIITSLTKMFSGACNVMGGSVVLNSQSPFYGSLRSRIKETHEDLMFPVDAETLLRNCLDFPARVQKANSNALAIANFLKTRDLISHVNYPTTVATAPLYEQYRRPNGGYGYLLSLVFKSPENAIEFYNTVDLCKGPSCGTNFTLVLPYSQVSHAFELDWAESQGMAKHIVRISVGLEEEFSLIKKLDQALQEVKSGEIIRPS